MTNTRTPLREIVAYLGIAYSLALTIALALPDANINKMLSVLVPTVTVGILTFTLTPKGSRKKLWRGIGLGRAGLKAWPAAIVLPIVLCAGAYGTAVALGIGRLDIDVADATPTWAISWGMNFLIGAVVGTVFILGEEIGWRGYLLPRMQQLTSKRRAAVVTGFVHGCFHLPLILIASTYNTEGSRWVAAPVAVAVITAGGVFYAWIWDRAQTAWPVAIAHNTVNTVFALGSTAVVATGGTTVAYVAGETGFATLGVCVIAAVVLLRKARVWRSTQVGVPAQELVAVPAA
jgi:membrane protease YdiL (CAAX protease family)